MDPSILHLLPLLLLCSCLLLQQPAMALLPLHPFPDFHMREDVGEEISLGRHPYYMIFHPPTGFCVLRKSRTDPLKLGPCNKSDPWSYTPQNFLTLKGTYFCLQAVGAGEPVRLGVICSPSNSQWKFVSNSGESTHLATKLADGSTLCLDIDSDDGRTLVSGPCKRRRSHVDPRESEDSQWFKIINGRRSSEN